MTDMPVTTDKKKNVRIALKNSFFTIASEFLKVFETGGMSDV